MSQKTKTSLEIVAIVMVLLAVGMHVRIIVVPALMAYKFWLAVAGFCALLSAR